MPTPHYLARSVFQLGLASNYIVGPPRYTDQISQTVILGKAPSWQAQYDYHLTMTIMTYTDPTRPADISISLAGPNSSGTLSLQSIQVQPSSSNQTLPTHLTWSVNSSSSTGIFSGAKGEGILNIGYSRSHGGPHAQAGDAYAHFEGLVFLSGTQNLSYRYK